jgi:hypothetical protein
VRRQHLILKHRARRGLASKLAQAHARRVASYFYSAQLLRCRPRLAAPAPTTPAQVSRPRPCEPLVAAPDSRRTQPPGAHPAVFTLSIPGPPAQDTKPPGSSARQLTLPTVNH